MPSDTPVRFATYTAPLKARRRASTATGEIEEYVKDSPALVADTATSDDVSSLADECKPLKRRASQGRAVWLLIGWLVVSISMITIAGITIAKYF